MRQSVSDSNDFRDAGFQKIVDGFLLHPGVPFASLVTAEKIARIFRKHGGLFGENRIYNTAVVLWAFLGQVLRNRKEPSCQSAIARSVVILSLATAMVMDVVLGPYQGKETGEPAFKALRRVCDQLLKRIAG